MIFRNNDRAWNELLDVIAKKATNDILSKDEKSPTLKDNVHKNRHPNASRNIRKIQYR